MEGLTLVIAVSFSIGLVMGAALAAWYARAKIQQHDPTPNIGGLALLLVMGIMLLGVVSPALAQTPAPTITIPTNVIFSETNTWIATFAPVAAIGIGITIALAVLGYLGKMIASAFRG